MICLRSENSDQGGKPLAFLVLGKKNKLRNSRLVILALLSGVGAYVLGALVGLILVAKLTTAEAE